MHKAFPCDSLIFLACTGIVMQEMNSVCMWLGWLGCAVGFDLGSHQRLERLDSMESVALSEEKISNPRPQKL